MMQKKQWMFATNRIPLNEFPKVSLPFYPRSCGHFVLDSGWREDIPADTKDMVQFFWFIRGEAEFLLNGSFRRMKSGDVCYHLPGEPHIHQVIAQHTEYRWIAFDGEKAGDFLLDFGYPPEGWHAGECPENLFQECMELLREMTPYSFRRMCSIITEIIALAGKGAEQEDRELQLFHRALKLCMVNFSSREFNVNALADLLGVNRTTLGRHFLLNMGRSPGKYIDALRIQKAVSLLQNTGKTLNEIAEISGFRDANYLCRVIKKEFGITPGKMRY